MALPSDTASRIALMREHLYTAVVGDVLDAIGRRHQFLPPTIKPMLDSMAVVGRAMPVIIGDVAGPQSKPFGLLTAALDQLEPGEVYLARGGRTPCAAWGEILTATARLRGAVGAVIDSYHRDTSRVLQQDFPVFSRGAFGQDAAVRTIVTAFRVPVEIGQVAVQPNDLVFGDRDGVVVIPGDVEDEVLERALDKATKENLVREAIENGMTSAEAFAAYGVL